MSLMHFGVTYTAAFTSLQASLYLSLYHSTSIESNSLNFYACKAENELENYSDREENHAIRTRIVFFFFVKIAERSKKKLEIETNTGPYAPSS